MNQNQRPVEKEYRSSHMYKALTNSGIPAADKLAEGLGKAAAGIDQAINAVGPAVKSAAGSVQNHQRPPVDGTYHYTYRYQVNTSRTNTGKAGNTGKAAAPQYRPPQNTQTAKTAQTAQNSQNTPPQGTAGQTPRQPRPGEPGWGWNNNVRPPQGVTPVPPPKMPQNNAVPSAPGPNMKMVREGSPAKFYITGVTALLYALNAPMTEPANFAVFAIVVALVFLLSGALFKGKKKFVPIEAPKPQPEPEPEAKKEPEKKSSTGNPEVDKIIDEGHGYLRQLREANDAIPDEALSADIDRMERASADIFSYIAKHPGKAPQIRKFMNYYLPTTLKLLHSYEHLSKQSVKGENITSTMFNIAGMMHTVADAFEKQLDSLFTDEAMDISADITVFETMLKQEGFVEEKNGTKLG